MPSNLSQYDSITIEPNWDHEGFQSGFNVYGHGEYEAHSVLAGHPKRSFLDAHDDVNVLIARFPSADVIDYSSKVEVQMSTSAPSWFDPMDAGESWGEDDY